MKRIFLGKVINFAGSGTAAPIQIDESNATHSIFNNDFLGKTDAQMKPYRGRLVFIGKADAPSRTDSDDTIVESAANDQNLIVYMDAEKATGAVKTVHKF